MSILMIGRAVALAVAILTVASTAQSVPDDDRASHLYPANLPGTLGCIDSAGGRVTWGCD